jgi:mannosyltransferase
VTPPGLRRAVSWAAEQFKAHATVFFFCGVFLVGLGARLYNIGSMPFWLDEVTTVHRSSLPFWHMVHDALAAHHLPSYFFVISVISHYGLSETVLRMPSAVFGGAVAGMIFLVGERVSSWRAGLVAGLLLALSPLQVQYGQEARAYTFVMFMMTIGLLGLIELARNPREASQPWKDPDARLSPWIIYLVGTIGALQVLSTAFFWLISANCAAVAILADKAVDRRRFLFRWLVVQALVVLLTLPWFGAMVVVTKGKMTDATDWVRPITMHSFLSTFGSLYLMRISRLISFHLFPAVVPGFGVLLLAFGVMGLARLRPPLSSGDVAGRSSSLLPTLGIAAAVPPLIILLISMVKPLWMPRYLMWSSVPFFVLVGIGVEVLPTPRLRTIATATLVLLAAINLVPYYGAETKPRWDLAALDLKAAMRPGDLLLVPDRGPIDMMNFFLGQENQEIPHAVWTKDVFVAAAHLQEGGRVWVVSGKVGQADRTSRKSFEEIISPLGQSIRTFQEGQLITLKLFAKPAADNLIADGS